MRVLVFFGGRMLESRGTPSRVRNLTSSLAAIPEVALAAVSGDDTREIERTLGIEHHEAGSVATRGPSLCRIVDTLKPDVVWGHTHKALVELALVRATDTAAICVADLHGDVAAEKLEGSGRPAFKRLAQYARWRMRETRLLRGMHAFTVVTERLARRIRRLGKPTLTLWGGVDSDLFRARPEPVSDILRVAYAGNFRAYQGIEILLDAAEELSRADRPFEFHLIGDSSTLDANQLRRLKNLGRRVILQPPVAYEEIPAILSQAHMLVIPRPDHRSARYGFPSKLPEYLSLGRPVVVTDVGDQARVVQHMETGIVIAPGDASALAGALRGLEDHALRERLGAAAARFAKKSLSWERMAADAASFFTTVRNSHAS